MATAKKNLGKMPCPHCGDPVAVMQALTGTLSYKCQDADCESSGYAPAHTGAARKWLAAVPAPALEKPLIGDPPKAGGKTEKTDKTTQPPKGGFGIGAL